MSLLEKLKKSSTIKEISTIDESIFFKAPEFTSTPVPAINIALSGDLSGGLESGLMQLVADSKHFKTNFALLLGAAYQKRYKDAVILFFDSEFGASKKYLESADIDLDRFLHVPITNIEEMKFEAVSQLEALKRGDRVIFIVDSIGNLASKKETDDAIDQKSVADMSRAKALASCFRIITPYLKAKDIPMIVINHHYKDQSAPNPKYAGNVVSGGKKIYLSSETIWIITRSTEKDGEGDVSGYTFNITIDKSRRVKEKTKIPVTVTFDGGIQRDSGLFDLASDLGYIKMTTKGWYQRCDPSTGELIEPKFRRGETNFKWFKWFLESPEVQQAIKEMYQLSNNSLVSEDDFDVEGVIGEDDE